MEKRGPSYTLSGNVSWYSHYRETVSLKKLGIKLPYDPTVPLLGIYPEKTIIEKDTCTPVFIAALFIIARMWKQPRCPLTDGYRSCDTYIQWNISHKRNKFESVLMRWMNLEPVIQSEEVRKRKRNTVFKAYIWNIEK